jgi:hypothetical protein
MRILADVEQVAMWGEFYPHSGSRWILFKVLAEGEIPKDAMKDFARARKSLKKL